MHCSVCPRSSRLWTNIRVNKTIVSFPPFSSYQVNLSLTSVLPDVIVSLTRTRTVGYLRDVRRLTVALSRARLGLYILGRRDVFESCYELKPAFDTLLQRPDKLMLAPGEMFPTTRSLQDEVQGTPMEGVEHLGQYVFEMTQAKLKSMGEEGIVENMDITPDGDVLDVDEDEVMLGTGEEGGGEREGEDPLHEHVLSA